MAGHRRARHTRHLSRARRADHHARGARPWAVGAWARAERGVSGCDVESKNWDLCTLSRRPRRRLRRRRQDRGDHVYSWARCRFDLLLCHRAAATHQDADRRGGRRGGGWTSHERARRGARDRRFRRRKRAVDGLAAHGHARRSPLDRSHGGVRRGKDGGDTRGRRTGRSGSARTGGSRRWPCRQRAPDARRCAHHPIPGALFLSWRTPRCYTQAEPSPSARARAARDRIRACSSARRMLYGRRGLSCSTAASASCSRGSRR